VAINACSGAKRGDKLINFMKGMAQGHTIGHVDRATLREWYKFPQVRRWLGDQLRDTNDGSHEWIPCKLIMDVIDRAANYDDLNEGAKWIEMQHLLRTDTSWIIFKPYPEPHSPAMAEVHQGHTILWGHIGAVYLEEGNERVGQVIKGRDVFHDECCAAFSGGGPTNLPVPKTIDECIDNIKGVFTRWIWNGEQPALPLHPSLWTQREGGLNIAQSKATVVSQQKTRYNLTEAKFEWVRGKVHEI